ncbi:protein translocase subunit SecD [Janibacter sp. GXQ6167]|uniref:protein translocase subunit SecD n=1 Tax=Janibacter sp. GXQ6167 TaxID=3240791 RepID=UPI003525FEDC
MAADRRPKDIARRTLVWFFALTLGLLAALAGGVIFKDAAWAPKLGLDLAGGTQIVLEPRVPDGQQVTTEQVEQARDIIVQRVDAQGVSGAEVTTLGETNIVIAMPGAPTAEQEQALAASSEMQFRPVLATGIGSLEPQPTDTGTTSPGDSTETTSPTSDGSATVSPDNRTSTPASRQQSRTTTKTTSPADQTSSPTDSATTAPDPSLPTQPPFTPSAKPTGPIDPNWITTKVWSDFNDLDCSKGADGLTEDRDGAVVACSTDQQTKYVLGPVVVPGSEISDASAGYSVGQQGQVTNTPEIQLSFKDTGRDAYARVSSDMVQLPGITSAQMPPGKYNALATVLDGQVIIAPGFESTIPNGQARITGGFSIEEARSLAKQLKFGALPLSFDLQTRQEISPTLGNEQLRMGLIAGLIGLLLVLGYAILQYRALAVVTIGSMLMAALLTYLAIALLGWGYNYRLDMAGVTGLIVAIGVTADSFIVYFERVRDELRDGRNLRAAVEAGWARAKRTILVADGVNFIAAVVLYVLASSGVRGFAFTLGLTTLIDLLVVFMFTHPLLGLLARTRFYSSGHKWSGFSVGQVHGASVRYAGRGRVAVRPATEEGGAR